MLGNTIVENLRQRITSLEETQRRSARTISIADAVDRALPHGGLSAGCIHEVKGTSLANAIAFSAILSSRLAGDEGDVLYIASDRSLHPLGLLPFGVKLNHFLQVSTRTAQDLAWTVMEALRCPQISSVIASINGLDLTESRRLQLAAEANGTTGFFFGHTASDPIAAPITRWKISSIAKPGQRFDEPAWAIDLLYCRGGRPGNWTLQWTGQKLNSLFTQPAKQTSAQKAMAG